MAFRHKFEFGLAWRTLLLVAAMWLLFEAISTDGLRAGRVVAFIMAVLALLSLWNFIRRTNFQVARFIDSVRFEDYSQRFSDPSGGGFDILGDALDSAMKSLQQRHVKKAAEARYLSAILDDAPSVLLSIDEEGRIELLNKAARQFLGRQQLANVADLDALGPEIAAAAQLPPGSRKITRVVLDGVPQKAIFASAQVARLEGGVMIISILPVQSELGAVEVAAQADLARILTHEIMNSLTPVTSLARTAADMIAASDGKSGLEDARAAADTVARRAEGILRFVESYRDFARSPEVHRRQFPAKGWAQEVLDLALATMPDRQVDAAVEISSATMKLDADPELLGQALLNLLRNSLRATASLDEPMIRLSLQRQAGGQCRIEVRDNGPGIAPDRREDIFLPFYTTHQGGSGVGLSFARQVVLAHGGSISALEAPEGGACLQIVV